MSNGMIIPDEFMMPFLLVVAGVSLIMTILMYLGRANKRKQDDKWDEVEDFLTKKKRENTK